MPSFDTSYRRDILLGNLIECGCLRQGAIKLKQFLQLAEGFGVDLESVFLGQRTLLNYLCDFRFLRAHFHQPRATTRA